MPIKREKILEAFIVNLFCVSKCNFFYEIKFSNTKWMHSVIQGIANITFSKEINGFVNRIPYQYLTGKQI
jgi:hypothetical protein